MSLSIAIRAQDPDLAGTINLSPLTIIAGAAASGKTRLLRLLHATGNNPITARPENSYTDFSSVLPQGQAMANLTQSLVEFSQQKDPDELANTPNIPLRQLPQALQDWAKTVASQALTAAGQAAAESLAKYHPQGPVRLSVTHNNPLFRIRATNRQQSHTINAIDLSDLTVANFPFLSRELRQSAQKDPDQPTQSTRDILIWTGEAVLKRLFGQFPKACHYIPATRAGLLLTYPLVGAQLVRRPHHSHLTAEVRDFIADLLALNNRPTPEPMAPALATLEQEVLGGRFILEHSKSDFLMPELLWQPAGGESQPLATAPGGALNLAPIYLALAHAANPGDLMLIDDPSAGLDPDQTDRLGKALLQAVTEGQISIAIATHSESLLKYYNDFTLYPPSFLGSAYPQTAVQPKIAVHAIKAAPETDASFTFWTNRPDEELPNPADQLELSMLSQEPDIFT